jgi:beta-galactosidase GanA
MPRPDEFHLCVQYYRQPTPPAEEWEEDLKHIKTLGFTAVQLRPQWAWHEVKEGIFRWDDIDRLMDLTAEVGLKVLFKFFLESAPLWLFKEYKADRITPDGTRFPHRGRGSFYLGGWMPCFDRPVVWEKAERFVTNGALRYRERENLLGWHLWNEPRSRPYEDCACADSVAMYRKWLADTFGSIEKFNERFGVAVRKWEDIDPPPDISAYYDSWLWRTFRAHAVAKRIHKLAALVRKYDNTRPVFTHVGFNSVLQPTFIDTSHDYLTAAAVDVYGTSLLHWTGDFHTFFKVDRSALFTNPDYREEAYLYSLQARWMGAVKDYFWINEIYGNAWNYMAEDYTGDDLGFMLLSTISEGARGIVIWQFKPERFSEESITSGLVELDGSDTERSLAAGRVCQARAQDPEAFRTYRPEKAKVAIVFHFGADMYSEMEDAENIESTGTVCYRYKESLKGYYGLLWRLGLAVDLVPVEELARIREYRLVVLPYMHLMDREQAYILAYYVGSGGILVSDPGLAFRDGRAWVQPIRPGLGLEKIFGCREKRLKAILEPRKIKAAGLKLTATRMLGKLVPQDKASDLSEGAGLLVANKRGKGKTFYFGFYPGVSYRDTGEEAYLRLVAELLAECGIETNYEPAAPLVRVRCGSVGNNDKRPAAFVFNYEDTEAEPTLHKLPEGAYRCVLSGRRVDTAKPTRLSPREILFLVPLDFG